MHVYMYIKKEVKEYQVHLFPEQYRKAKDLVLFYQLLSHHATYNNALISHVIPNSQTPYQCQEHPCNVIM